MDEPKELRHCEVYARVRDGEGAASAARLLAALAPHLSRDTVVRTPTFCTRVDDALRGACSALQEEAASWQSAAKAGSSQVELPVLGGSLAAVQALVDAWYTALEE